MRLPPPDKAEWFPPQRFMKISSLPKLSLRAYHATRKYMSIENASMLALQEGLKEHKDTVDIAYQKAVLERICNAYNNAISHQANVPLPYQPGSKWKIQNERERHEYLQALKDYDFPTLLTLFENFFRNNGSRSILRKTLYPYLTKQALYKPFIQMEFIVEVLHDIEVWKNYFEKDTVEDLRIPKIGNPFGYHINGVTVTGSSASSNYYAKRCNSLISDISNPVVAEIGSGFGGLFYYLSKENPNATCIDFDLPEILVIAQYFLMMAFPEKQFLLFKEQGSEKKITKATLNNYDMILLPNFQLVDLVDSTVDLFINFHSLSEMDSITIDEYIKQISRLTRGFFFHENSKSPHQIGYGKHEVPVSKYPISPKEFKLLYKMNAIWGETRYIEFLYSKKLVN